jgi:hypothetical protein
MATKKGMTARRARTAGTVSKEFHSTKKTGPAKYHTALPAELRALRKMVLFQKVKQELLTSKNIGSIELDTLLSNYLTVILKLTDTSQGMRSRRYYDRGRVADTRRHCLIL